MASKNEKLEETTRQWAYPNARRLNKAQKGVDFVDGTAVEIRVEHHPKTGTETIVETHSGGKWIQLKRLEPVKNTPAEVANAQRRLGGQVDLAFKKLDSQLSKPAAKAWSNTDGSAHKYELHAPETFEVRLELPGYDELKPADQLRLRNAMTSRARAAAAAYEIKQKVSVVVAEPPPADFIVKPDGPAAKLVKSPSLKPALKLKSPELAVAKFKLATASTDVVKEAIRAETREAYLQAQNAIRLGNKPGRGFAKVGNVLLMLYVVGGAVYVYTQAPEGEKLQEVGRFLGQTGLEIGISSAAEAMVRGTGFWVGFALMLEDDMNPEDRAKKKRWEMAQKIVGDMHEADKNPALRDQMCAEVAELLAADPLSLDDKPINRTFNGRSRVLQMDTAAEPETVAPKTARKGKSGPSKALVPATAQQRAAVNQEGTRAARLALENARLAQRTQTHAGNAPGAQAVTATATRAAQQAARQAVNQRVPAPKVGPTLTPPIAAAKTQQVWQLAGVQTAQQAAMRVAPQVPRVTPQQPAARAGVARAPAVVAQPAVVARAPQATQTPVLQQPVAPSMPTPQSPKQKAEAVHKAFLKNVPSKVNNAPNRPAHQTTHRAAVRVVPRMVRR